MLCDSEYYQGRTPLYSSNVRRVPIIVCRDKRVAIQNISIIRSSKLIVSHPLKHPKCMHRGEYNLISCRIQQTVYPYCTSSTGTWCQCGLVYIPQYLANRSSNTLYGVTHTWQSHHMDVCGIDSPLRENVAESYVLRHKTQWNERTHGGEKLIVYFTLGHAAGSNSVWRRIQRGQLGVVLVGISS